METANIKFIEVMLKIKIRFIEPGNQPYRKSLLNYFVYDKYIRTPSHGLMTLAAIVKRVAEDVLNYVEAASHCD